MSLCLCLAISLGSCNKQIDSSSASEVSAMADSGAVGNPGLADAEIILPEDTEVTLVVDYHGWDVATDTGDPRQRDHVFSVLATWGHSLHQELREIVAKEGEAAEARLDIGGGQVLSISPQWNERQKGSYLFKVEDRSSGKAIAAFDARDTNEIASLTDTGRYGHHTKIVMNDLPKRVILQEVKAGGQADFSRNSEFGLAYVGSGFKDMPVCKVNNNSHWHFPRFEAVACPEEWMAKYSFKGLGEKLRNSKGGVEGTAGVQAIDWDKMYTAQKRAQRSCSTGGG
jgi:hypothetical protein